MNATATAPPPPQPLPGDCLLYNKPWDPADIIIRLKTWSPVAHVEGYVSSLGNGYSVASRADGVNLYPFRSDGLAAILRPNRPFNLVDALDWFYKSAKGQKYDWKGLLCFALAVHQGSPNKMFCSEFMTRWYRAGGFDAMNRRWDADKVAPGSLLMTSGLDWIWTSF